MEGLEATGSLFESPLTQLQRSKIVESQGGIRPKFQRIVIGSDRVLFESKLGESVSQQTPGFSIFRLYLDGLFKNLLRLPGIVAP